MTKVSRKEPYGIPLGKRKLNKIMKRVEERRKHWEWLAESNRQFDLVLQGFILSRATMDSTPYEKSPKE